jgi:hypothetical protein
MSSKVKQPSDDFGNPRRRFLMVLLLAVVVDTVLRSAVFTPTTALAQRPAAPPSGLPDLVGGLKATPGCLGVETAMTSSGKQVIFAWFENRAALLKWYESPMHQQVMSAFFPTGDYDEPLKTVPKDFEGPIMAVASLTPKGAPNMAKGELPVSQISIELYGPLSGGIFVGGRFAPDGMKVPGIKEYQQPAK